VQRRQIQVERISVVSSRRFEDVIATLDAAIGHPDMVHYRELSGGAASFAQLQSFVHQSVGKTGLMEFQRFDDGGILRKESGRATPKILRYLIGNPLIMKEMARHVPEAGAYAPVTVLVDERSDGVHLGYDTMTSLLAPYGSAAALAVARDLDAKIELLLQDAAAG
jgi:uncharacterized protein (DUF302 family)